MLRIEHLTKNYKSFSLDCTMEVKPGCVTGLIGQNGAGKSTTFKAALGLVRPDGGNIRILGRDIRDFGAKDRQKLGVVLSDSGFSGYLTVADTVPVLGSLYEDFDKAFFLEQIRKAGLPDNKKIKEFSTGMKAKLKVITAISHNARLLILDEPTSGLDVVARDELLELLREKGIYVTSWLPLLWEKAEEPGRRVEEVCARAAALLIVALYSECRVGEHMSYEDARKFVDPILADYGAEGYFSPEEKNYLDNPDSTEKEQIQFAWQYENLWVMEWALGLTDDLFWPDRICDVPASARLMQNHPTMEALLAAAKLRSRKELLLSSYSWNRALKRSWSSSLAKLPVLESQRWRIWPISLTTEMTFLGTLSTTPMTFPFSSFTSTPSLVP